MLFPVSYHPYICIPVFTDLAIEETNSIMFRSLLYNSTQWQLLQCVCMCDFFFQLACWPRVCLQQIVICKIAKSLKALFTFAPTIHNVSYTLSVCHSWYISSSLHLPLFLLSCVLLCVSLYAIPPVCILLHLSQVLSRDELPYVIRNRWNLN